MNAYRPRPADYAVVAATILCALIALIVEIVEIWP